MTRAVEATVLSCEPHVLPGRMNVTVRAPGLGTLMVEDETSRDIHPGDVRVLEIKALIGPRVRRDERVNLEHA